MQISRRALLGAGAAGSLIASQTRAEGQKRRFRRKPRNIIFCVADGMSLSTLTMCDQFQQITEGRHSYWMNLLNAEYATSGLQETRSLNSLVTDSAAASSAWGSGRRQWNGQLNMYPDGTRLRPIMSLMQEAGLRCGLVTTTTITHATPAGFAVNSLTRQQEDAIAQEYLKAGVDVLLGGGDRFFAAQQRKDRQDLYTAYAQAGYRVVRTKSELLGAVPAARLLGVFHSGHMPYSVDHNHSSELQSTRPRLREMARAAIACLKPAPGGFFMQIEGGRVDHAAHSNDLAGLIYDQIEFEETVREVVEFALKDRHTLVIITTDHATGGPSLNGSGIAYQDSAAGLQKVASMKASYDTLFKALGDAPTPDKIRQTVRDLLDITLTPEEAETVAQAARKNSPFRVSEFYEDAGATLAIVLGNHTKVTWTSQNHTSDHVLITAVGPGSELIAGLHANVDLFSLMTAARDIKYENPTMDYATARAHFEKIRHLWAPGG